MYNPTDVAISADRNFAQNQTGTKPNLSIQRDTANVDR